MKTPLVLGLLSLLILQSPAADLPDHSPVFELRLYQPNPGKFDALLARFRDHTRSIFTRLGMTNVAYWSTLDTAPDADRKLIYLLGHPNRSAAKTAWTQFRTDPEWIECRDASEKDGKLASSVEAIFLTPTDYAASMTPANLPAGYVIEMRTYRTLPGRLAALDARFRDHTKRLFEKHGMINLGYFHPQDADKGAGQTLVYFLAHASRAAAKTSWAAFQADPEWIAARDASQADGNILQPKGVTSVFLGPVNFASQPKP